MSVHYHAAVNSNIAEDFVPIREPLSTLVEVPYLGDLRQLCLHFVAICALIWLILMGLRMIREPLARPDMPGKTFNVQKYYYHYYSRQHRGRVYGPRCT